MHIFLYCLETTQPLMLSSAAATGGTSEPTFLTAIKTEGRDPEVDIVGVFDQTEQGAMFSEFRGGKQVPCLTLNPLGSIFTSGVKVIFAVVK